jgi:hypothetical protein
MRVWSPLNAVQKSKLCLIVFLFGNAAWVAAEPAVVQGERLSNYLRRNQMIVGVEPNAQLLDGLLLRRPSLLADQSLSKTRLTTELFIHRGDGNQAFLSLLDRLPVTGRLVLESTDADYLRQHPNLDPVLQAEDTVQLAKPSMHVQVLFGSGQCVVEHQPGATAIDYLKACGMEQSFFDSSKRVDQVWLIQPTGEVKQSGVAQWNASAVVSPRPGARILAPLSTSGLTDELVAQLAAFLSTQEAYRPSREEIEQARIISNVSKPLRELPVSSNDFGLVGLLQTPSARMRSAGYATVTASRVAPYSRYSIILQPFDWLEGGLRYTKITNRLYGPEDFSGDQKYLDKNIDLKVRLNQESAYLPEVAIGLQDIGGTGLFSGEYLVANKRFGNVDASLGLGFGYLGRAGGVNNPLGILSSRFNTRPAQSTSIEDAGKVSVTDFFRGPAALFGGLQWHTPWERWTLKLEYEGNNYQQEPLDNPQVQKTRFNYGLVYKVSDSVNFHVGVERGDTLQVGVSLFENFSTFNTPKPSDSKPLAVDTSPRPTQVDWPKTLQRFKAQTDLNVTQVQQRGSEVKLTVRNGRAAYANQTLERAAEVLHQDLPENVKWFSLEYENNGASVGQHMVDRGQFVQRRTQYNKTKKDDYKEVSAVEGFNMPYNTLHDAPAKFFENKTGLGYQQVLGGADGLLYQFFLANDTRLNFSKSTWLNGRLAYRLIDNYEKFKQRATSNLPQVRTNLREYAITSDFTMPNLAVKHMGKLGGDHFYGVYGGYLEPMFAGVGAEYLYRPHNSWYAIGLDVNRVRQRAFEQDFSVLPYTVNTGHVTAYMDTGIQDIQLAVSAGQYLAGDKGVTVDVSREFKNGTRIGAFVTRTNVSAADFGEGSFDKGIYLTVPLSAFFTKTIPGDAVFLWRPLTRDGGAKLSRGFSLYGETEMRNPRVLKRRVRGEPE